MYASAILIDIKSVFNRIDRSLKSREKNAELAVLVYCKEAIDLHARVYGYFSLYFLQWANSRK